MREVGFNIKFWIYNKKVLFATAFIILLLLLSGGFLFYNQQVDKLYFFYGEMLQQVSVHEAHVIENKLQHHRLLTQGVSTSPFFKRAAGHFSADSEIQCNSELKKYLNQVISLNSFSDISIYSNSGKLICSALPEGIKDSLSADQLRCLKDSTLDFYFDMSNGQTNEVFDEYISLAHKFTDSDDNPAGIMIFSMNIRNSIFNSILSWPLAEANGEFIICRKIGSYLHYWGNIDGKIQLLAKQTVDSANEIETEISKGSTGLFFGPDFRGDKAQVFVDRIEDTEFFLLSSVRKDEIMRNVPDIIAFVMAYVLLIFLGVSLILVFLYNRYKSKMYLEAVNNERSVRLQQKRLELLMNNMSEGVIVTDLDDKITYVNQQILSIYGYKENELIGKIGYEVLEDESSRNYVRSRKIHRLEGEKESYVVIGVKKNREKIWIRINAAPVYDENNIVVGTIGIISDITASKRAEDELHKKDQILTSILQTQQEFICRMLPDGTLTFVNKAYCEFFKKTEKELLGSNFLQFVPEQFREEELLILNSLNFEKKNITSISQVRDIHGCSHVMEWTDTALFDSDMKVVEIQSVGRDVTEKIKTQNKLNEALMQVKNYSMYLQNVREEEKISLAREIHDDLGQILVALKIDNGMIKLSLKRDVKLFERQKVASLIEKQSIIIDKAIISARRIMNGLRPVKLELLGLTGAVNDYLCEYAQRYQINSRFSSNTEALKLDPDKSLAVYRIIQEALTNVIKHATATSVSIRIEVKAVDDIVEVSIEDNGVGFVSDSAKNIDSYGVLGMNERATLLNGEVQILSSPGVGTNVILKFPYLINSKTT